MTVHNTFAGAIGEGFQKVVREKNDRFFRREQLISFDVRLLSLSPSKQRTDTSEYISDGERLDNVIIDAEFHTGGYVFVENLRGH